MSLQRLALAGGTVLMVAACSSTPPPRAELAAGRAAVDSAQSAGARDYAGPELESARRKLDLAEQAVRNDENALARRLAEAAEADARLAAGRAREARARAAAQEVEQSLQTLQQELQRSAQ